MSRFLLKKRKQTGHAEAGHLFTPTVATRGVNMARVLILVDSTPTSLRVYFRVGFWVRRDTEISTEAYGY